VQNYYNLGMILRICLAFKIRNIFLSKNSVDVYHPLVVSASRGAVFDVCVFSADFKEVEPLFKTSSYEVITTVACEKQNFTLKNFPFLKQEKYVIIFGNEGHGLVANKHLMKVRKTISIPTEGTMKSLNLAVSSAIIAYELSSFFNK
jgi:tRNA G18 (ribose-2'-O)-methylase SpoU